MEYLGKNAIPISVPVAMLLVCAQALAEETSNVECAKILDHGIYRYIYETTKQAFSMSQFEALCLHHNQASTKASGLSASGGYKGATGNAAWSSSRSESLATAFCNAAKLNTLTTSDKLTFVKQIDPEGARMFDRCLELTKGNDLEVVLSEKPSLIPKIMTLQIRNKGKAVIDVDGASDVEGLSCKGQLYDKIRAGKRFTIGKASGEHETVSMSCSRKVRSDAACGEVAAEEASVVLLTSDPRRSFSIIYPAAYGECPPPPACVLKTTTFAQVPSWSAGPNCATLPPQHPARSSGVFTGNAAATWECTGFKKDAPVSFSGTIMLRALMANHQNLPGSDCYCKTPSSVKMAVKLLAVSGGKETLLQQTGHPSMVDGVDACASGLDADLGGTFEAPESNFVVKLVISECHYGGQVGCVTLQGSQIRIAQ